MKKLGGGGDGTVYLVRHAPTDQLRAAKELKETVWKQRMHELDMMKRLTHPAFPQIFDLLEEQGRLWLIMEFINGRALSRLPREEQNAALFVSVARQLADALVYLHTRSMPVLHLDIKPSNIILQPEGRLVLLDFGAAMRGGSDDRFPARFGTPGFAAPEQGRPDTVLDVRADFYGYGAVLYYCLFGKAPVSGDRVRRELLSVKTGWKRMAVPLLLRCLAEDREQRYQDTHCLYRAVCRMEKQFRICGQIKRGGIAALFLLVVLFFAASNLRWDSQSEAASADAGEAYDALLEEAGSLGFEQAVSCYEQAVNLCPEDSAWCESLLERIEEDYLFSAEEEAALKKLIFLMPQGRDSTECDLLEKASPEYGELAYRIGLEYWYFYEGAGGRSAAARWFERAVSSQEKAGMRRRDGDTQAETGQAIQTGGQTRTDEGFEADTPEWVQAAFIYARISSYYEKLGKRDMDGNRQASPGVYWADLKELWEVETAAQGKEAIRMEIAQEMLSILVLQTYDLVKEGAKIDELREMLGTIGTFIEKTAGTGDTAQRCREQYVAAQEAVERVSANERRMDIDE